MHSKTPTADLAVAYVQALRDQATLLESAAVALRSAADLIARLTKEIDAQPTPSEPQSMPAETEADAPPSAPVDPKIAAMKAQEERRIARAKRDAEIKTNTSAEIKTNLLHHISQLEPGSARFKADFDAYRRMRDASWNRILECDRTAIIGAEHYEVERHKTIRAAENHKIKAGYRSPLDEQPAPDTGEIAA